MKNSRLRRWKQQITQILVAFTVICFLSSVSFAEIPHHTNISPLSWVTRTESSTGPGTFSGTFSNEWDENLTTYRQWYLYRGGDGSLEGSLTGQFTWSEPRKIYRVYCKYRMANHAGNYMSSWMRFVTSLLIGGTWTEVDNHYVNTGAAGSSESGVYTLDYTFDSSTGWDNVTGIKSVLSGYAYSYEANGSRLQQIWQTIYEIKCFREKFVDKGLRTRTANATQEIGTNELASQPLRIRKGSTTYGIPLLDITDPNASPIRIYDGHSVKALPKID